MNGTYGFVLFILPFFACWQSPVPGKEQASEKPVPSEPAARKSLINTSGKTVGARFLLPEGFERTESDSTSFATYLRNLPLKPAGSKVKLYNGDEKGNDVYDAVVDLPIGNKDLQQCADAVMRLRAEYFFSKKEYDRIHFNFTNGFRCEYTEWMKGRRISVNGNKVTWKNAVHPSNTYQDFWSYLEIIFSYCGSLSLSKELRPADVSDLKPGDVFILGGTPGHAEIVVDAAVNRKTKEKIFLLAQSYMPAQEIQVLKNSTDTLRSPWYSVNFEDVLNTPEYPFHRNELMRFAD